MKRRKLKKAPKIILILLIIFLIIVGITINQNNKTPNSEQKLTQEEKILQNLKKIPYYKKENKNRYLKYQQEHKNKKTEEIVTDVNIGIDKPYYTNTKPSKLLNSNLILVNKYNYLTEDYIPENLEEISIEYARSGMQLVSEAKEAFETLSQEAKKDGMTIIAMSSYRSYDYQVNLYNNYVKSDGKDAADTYSARPGFSEHQTGLAVDIYNKELPYTSFEETKEFEWMQKNAYKYGFILRFPKDKVNITGYQYEAWHYRYVGKKAAKYIHDHNITLEEYYIKKVEN
ncbi:MAG: M15 family metallopeptidase [Candidatus Faecimonas sp.]|nr:M15 family metallopeptidase [Mycoplasmatota bacterium]MDY2908749.1 M15 family metallopeptidase [Candidatus Faecimonas sp.]